MELPEVEVRQTVDQALDQARRRRAMIERKVRSLREGIYRDNGSHSEVGSGDPMTSGLGSSLQNDLYSDTAYRQYVAALHEIDENIRTLENRRDREGGKDIGFWKGFGQTIADPGTWTGMDDLLDANAKLGASSVPAAESSRTLMSESYRNSGTQKKHGDFGFWNRAGVMSAGMLPFVMDFAITGGGFKGMDVISRGAAKLSARVFGKKAAREMAGKGFRAYIREHGIKALPEKAGDWIIRSLGTTADDLLVRAPLMANTVQLDSTAADVINRRLGEVDKDGDGGYRFSGGESWGSSLWQSEADLIIENFSEMSGARLDGVLDMRKLSGVLGAGSVSSVMSKADPKGYRVVEGKVRELFNNFGVSGYLGEVGEEYYGQLWRTVLNLDGAYMTDESGGRKNLFLDNGFHGDIWGGLALSMGLMGAARQTAVSSGYFMARRDLGRADRRAGGLFGKDEWESMRSVIDNTVNEDIGWVVESVMTDPETDERQKAAALDYIGRSLYLRGYNLGNLSDSRNAEVDDADTPSPDEALRAEVRKSADSSYMSGRESYVRFEEGTPEEQYEARADMDAVALRYREARELFEDVFGAEAEARMAEFKKSEWDLLTSPELTLDQQDAVLNYINASKAFDGVWDAAGESAERKRDAVDRAVEDRTHRYKGIIQPMVLKFDETGHAVDREVYLVGGNVALHEVVIELVEKNGGRHQTIRVENSDIVAAKVINELKIK